MWRRDERRHRDKVVKFGDGGHSDSLQSEELLQRNNRFKMMFFLLLVDSFFNDLIETIKFKKVKTKAAPDKMKLNFIDPCGSSTTNTQLEYRVRNRIIYLLHV